MLYGQLMQAVGAAIFAFWLCGAPFAFITSTPRSDVMRDAIDGRKIFGDVKKFNYKNNDVTSHSEGVF